MSGYNRTTEWKPVSLTHRVGMGWVVTKVTLEFQTNFSAVEGRKSTLRRNLRSTVVFAENSFIRKQGTEPGGWKPPLLWGDSICLEAASPKTIKDQNPSKKETAFKK